MRNFKTLAMIAALALAGAAFAQEAVSGTATLMFNNEAPDIVTATDATLTWSGAGDAVGSGDVTWNMRGASTLNRKITASIPEDGLPGGVTNLKITPAGGTAITLTNLAFSKDLLNALAPQTQGTKALNYAATIAETGFVDSESVVVTFTIDSDQ